MKFKLGLISVVALTFASCTGTRPDQVNDSISKVNKTADSITEGTKTANADYCFYTTEGTASQDTTKVQLHINGNQVTGTMSWLPKEKDSRKGTLAGSINNDQIIALWSYGQEGSKDTLTVAFELKDGQLTQKPYKYDAKTGQQETDKAAGYTVLYKNCQ